MAQEPTVVTASMMEVLYEGTEVKVWLERLAPGERFGLHRHNHVSDIYFVVSGSLSIEARQPDEIITVQKGETYRIQPGRPHRTINLGDESVEWILMQGIGKVDFEPMDQ